MMKSCDIDASDPRLADKDVAYLLNSLKCRLQVSTSSTSKDSMLETSERPALTTVYAALCITSEGIVMDIKQEGQTRPVEFLDLSFQDPLFVEMGIGFANSQRTCYLVVELPGASRFSKMPMDIDPSSTMKVFIDTPKAPDVSLHVQRVVQQLSSRCIITEQDPRLEGQEVVFHLNSMKCSLDMGMQTAEAAPVGRSKRSSIIGTIEAPARRTVFAALVVTREKMLLDLKKEGDNELQKEYLCISFNDELCKAVGLEHVHDAESSRLVLGLPNASTYFARSPGNLDVPPGASIQVFMHTWKAPDIVMYVKHQISAVAELSGTLGGSDCFFDQNDPRLLGQEVAFLLNNMKCHLQISVAPGGGPSRSSILGTETAPAARVVFAALAITDEKLMLDLKRVGKDDAPKEYLNIAFANDLAKEISLEYWNDQVDSHLVIVLPDAGRFFQSTDLDVPEHSLIKVYIRTWKAPDIAMFVRRKQNSGSASN
eukprot:TRINITY_DN14020_c0_g2_i1.p1 TRINITY_DN14020_c0_g2~~TRINITY_DN14020_c0_g2_i1.p1  ORF type:complete len:503 (+),score=77.48 TRINITY_DN14020_c0_g2_i1:58-1509(+)